MIENSELVCLFLGSVLGDTLPWMDIIPTTRVLSLSSLLLLLTRLFNCIGTTETLVSVTKAQFASDAEFARCRFGSV